VSLKTDFFGFFQQRPDVKLNRKVFVFIICLVISFFTWLQINLSKVHTDNVPVRVEFINLPKTRFGTTSITDTLLLEVESNGYTLLKYEMKDVSINFGKLKKDVNTGFFYFLPNNYTKTIGKQMGENFKVIRAINDTVQLIPRLR
jgi:hypothetical protein